MEKVRKDSLTGKKKLYYWYKSTGEGRWQDVWSKNNTDLLLFNIRWEST
jgi:hypothetical protein